MKPANLSQCMANSSVALLVAAIAFACSLLMLPANTATWSMGDEYARMSVDPFARIGTFPHRLLSPLLAHVLGLGGARYWLFSYATVLAFLAAVCATARQRGCSLPAAALLTAIIAVTGAVEVYKGYVGYCEPMSFLLLLACLAAARRPAWLWPLVFLGLLNHEGFAFYLPWVVYQRVTGGGGWRRSDWVGAAFAAGGYVLARQALTSGLQVLSVGFYLGDQKWSFVFGAWILLTAMVIVYFGLLPTLWWWHAHAVGRHAGIGALLVIAGVYGQTFLANDAQRFVGHLAIPAVLAGIELAQRRRGVYWLALVGGGTAALIVLQRPVVIHVVETMAAHPPDPVSALPTVIVPRLWYVFGSYAGLHVAMYLLGRGLGRRAARASTAAAQREPAGE